MKSLGNYREDSPVTSEQYKQIEKAIHRAAMTNMVARNLAPISGPFGLAKQSLTYNSLTEMGAAGISMSFITAGEGAVDIAPTTLPIPIIQKPFRISYRDWLSSRTYGTPLDTLNVASATYQVMKLEEDVLIDGHAADGSNYDVSGFYQRGNNAEATSKDFGTSTNGIAKAALAMALLRTDNIYPPYNMVLHSTQMNELWSTVLSGTAVFEYEAISKQLGGNDRIYETNSLTAATGMLMSDGDRGFFDIIMGVDLGAELEAQGLANNKDILGIVYEALTPRVKETNAICQLTNI